MGDAVSGARVVYEWCSEWAVLQGSDEHCTGATRGTRVVQGTMHGRYKGKVQTVYEGVQIRRRRRRAGALQGREFGGA